MENKKISDLLQEEAIADLQEMKLYFDFLELKGQLPEYFIGLLRGVETYTRNNPYGPEVLACNSLFD